MLRRLVPVLLILFVAATSVVAAEVSVSDFAMQTALGAKRLPTIAAGDGGYLAVWLDTRSADFTLMATRIAANGEPLDPLGIPLGPAEFFQPQVLWNGDGYLVFWNDRQGNLLVTKVSRDGIAEAPRVLREHAWLGQRPRALATNGMHLVLAYRGLGGSLHVAVMTPQGVLTDDRIVDARNSGGATVIANDGDFLVAWYGAGSDDFFAVRLNPRGAAIDTSPRKIGQGADPEILRNGSNYVAIAGGPDYVSWSVRRDLAQIGVPAPLQLDHRDRLPSLLDGSPGMMAVFESSENVFITAVTFDANGHEAGPRKRIVETRANHFAVARGNDSLSMIEVRAEGGWWDAIVGRIFDEATLARTAEDRALALSGSEEHYPAIAGGGGRYLTAWSGPRGLTVGRFLPDGTRLDGDGFVLDSPASYPAVAFDGERFVVSYNRTRNNQGETVMRFVSPADGLLPDVQTFEHTAYASSPTDLAVGGGVVLATWMRYDGVYAAAMRGMQVIAPARKIADTWGSNPVASWNGRQFLVTWVENDFDWDMSYPARLLSMRIESDLTPVDAQPRLLVELPVEYPVLAAWKGGWLIAFQDGNNIRLHEIDGDGAMKETPLLEMPGFSPKLVNAAAQPWLAWTSHENQLLRAVPVRSDGTLGTDGGLSITAPLYGASFGYHTALGSLGNDIAATYARVMLEAGSVRRAVR